MVDVELKLSLRGLPHNVAERDVVSFLSRLEDVKPNVVYVDPGKQRRDGTVVPSRAGICLHAFASALHSTRAITLQAEAIIQRIAAAANNEGGVMSGTRGSLPPFPKVPAISSPNDRLDNTIGSSEVFKQFLAAYEAKAAAAKDPKLASAVKSLSIQNRVNGDVPTADNDLKQKPVAALVQHLLNVQAKRSGGRNPEKNTRPTTGDRSGPSKPGSATGARVKVRGAAHAPLVSIAEDSWGDGGSDGEGPRGWKHTHGHGQDARRQGAAGGSSRAAAVGKAGASSGAGSRVERDRGSREKDKADKGYAGGKGSSGTSKSGLTAGEPGWEQVGKSGGHKVQLPLPPAPSTGVSSVSHSLPAPAPAPIQAYSGAPRAVAHSSGSKRQGAVAAEVTPAPPAPAQTPVPGSVPVQMPERHDKHGHGRGQEEGKGEGRGHGNRPPQLTPAPPAHTTVEPVPAPASRLPPALPTALPQTALPSSHTTPHSSYSPSALPSSSLAHFGPARASADAAAVHAIWAASSAPAPEPVQGGGIYVPASLRAQAGHAPSLTAGLGYYQPVSMRSSPPAPGAASPGQATTGRGTDRGGRGAQGRAPHAPPVHGHTHAHTHGDDDDDMDLLRLVDSVTRVTDEGPHEPSHGTGHGGAVGRGGAGVPKKKGRGHTAGSSGGLEQGGAQDTRGPPVPPPAAPHAPKAGGGVRGGRGQQGAGRGQEGTGPVPPSVPTHAPNAEGGPGQGAGKGRVRGARGSGRGNAGQPS